MIGLGFGVLFLIGNLISLTACFSRREDKRFDGAKLDYRS